VTRSLKIAPIVLLFCFALAVQGGCKQGPQVCAGNACVEVEVADTAEAMEEGLSGRELLDEGRGMLFVFPSDAAYGFWMKDMQFALDIVWLDASGRVVYLQENLPPCTPGNCPVYKPGQSARYVLEVNAGFVASHGIKPGTALTLPSL